MSDEDIKGKYWGNIEVPRTLDSGHVLIARVPPKGDSKQSRWEWQCKYCKEVQPPILLNNLLTKEKCNFCKSSDSGKYSAGDIFGKKMLVEYVGIRNYCRIWKWKCLGCGKERGPATVGKIKSTFQCEECSKRRENNKRWKGFRDIPGVYFTQIKNGAVKRGLSFDITIEDMWNRFEEQNGRCALIGEVIGFGYKSETTASLDRIDNSLGYSIDNIQWLHKKVNSMKSDLSMEEFKTIVGKIYEYSIEE